MQQKKKKVSDEHLQEINSVCDKYNHDKGEIINVLNDVQNIVGYLPKVVQQAIAEVLGVTEAKVGGLVGFYSFFRTYPLGKHVITVCQGKSCSIRRASDVLETFKNELNLEPGQTSADGKITLVSSGCMGACGLGPVTMVDDQTYSKNNPENVKKIVSELTNNKNIVGN